MTTAVRTAIISGVLLILWSVVSYFISESRSFTAFIPAIFGVLLAICGVIGRSEGARKHAMHAAAVVGLLGLLGGFGMGLRKVFSEPGLAAYSQVFLGVVSLVFLVTCIRSFIAARRGS
jgi:O-antigen/teichoic acid export membrane protein